jgi:hypothetical protein
MADAGRPIQVQTDRLIEASTKVAEHLATSAKQPTAAAPHLTAPAAPVDAAAAQAAAAMRARMAEMSTELAAKGPATQQAAAAAAASLQAQDAANSARLPSIPSPPSGRSDGSGAASRGAQMLGSGPSGMAPPPLAPGKPQPPPQPPPRPPVPRPTEAPEARPPDQRLRHLPPPSWTRPTPAENSSAAQRQYQQVIEDIKAHNSWRPDGSPDAVFNYNREAQWLNQTKQSLEDQLNGWKAPYDHSDLPAGDAQAPQGTAPQGPRTPRTPNVIDTQPGSGRGGDWNPDLRSPQPNTTYRVDGGKETYYTDSNGLTHRVDIKLDGPQPQGPQSRFDPPGMQPGDHRGHLVPRRFDGPGEEINLTAQQGNEVNQSTVRTIENEWAKILAQTGHLDASIEIIRDATGRPTQYIYEYYDAAGNFVSQPLFNVAGR